MSDATPWRFTETPYSSYQMSVIGVGVDVIECSRIQHSIERMEPDLHPVFTDGEIEYSMSMKFPERHLAARFAGKEAVAKAFGTGIGKAMGWRNIDIRKKESANLSWFFQGRPRLLPQNGASLRYSISLSVTPKTTLSRALSFKDDRFLERVIADPLTQTAL